MAKRKRPTAIGVKNAHLISKNNRFDGIDPYDIGEGGKVSTTNQESRAGHSQPQPIRHHSRSRIGWNPVLDKAVDPKKLPDKSSGE